MSTKRIVGLGVFALSVAIAVEILVEAGLTIANGGHFPAEPGYKLLMGLLPFPVLLVAGVRYWRITEFETPRTLQLPVFAVLVMLLVMAVGSMFVERPGGVEARSVEPGVRPTVYPSVVPASGAIVGSSTAAYQHSFDSGGVLFRNSALQISGRKEVGGDG